MRVPPMMLVEVDGQVVRRQGEIDILLYDRTGRPAVARVRPKLGTGERLVERQAAIPVIVTEVA